MTWDTEIALTDDQIRESRRTYQKRMLEQRAQAQSQTAAKQSAKKALEMVFASPTGCESVAYNRVTQVLNAGMVRRWAWVGRV